MNLELTVVSKGDSVAVAGSKPGYVEYELKILNKIILLLTGYDASPFFRTRLETGGTYQLGVYPDVIEIDSVLSSPHVSTAAISSLLKDIAHFGSAVHLVCKLQDSLADSYRDRERKQLAPSLAVLLLESPETLNEHEYGARASYDWYWKEDFDGFCAGLENIFNDWRHVMFKIQEKYFKEVNRKSGELALSPNMAKNPDDMKSPILDLFEKHVFIEETENLRVLDLYVNLTPFAKVMEGLASLLELFLNYLSANGLGKADMQNAMLTLLVAKIRASEMTRDRSLINLWRYLLYYVFKDRRDYLLTLSCQNTFAVFEHLMLKTKQVSQNISKMDPENAARNLELIFDNDLKRNLVKICTIDTQSIEHKFMSYLNAKFTEFISRGIGLAESILNTKYRYPHFLYLLNSIAMGKFVDKLAAEQTMRQKGLKSQLDQECRDWVKANWCILSGLRSDELEKLLSDLKIDFTGGIFVITMAWEEGITLFGSGTLKIYSAIFNQVFVFMRFKRRVDELALVHRWNKGKSDVKSLPTLLLRMIHLSNCLTTYYDFVIGHFWGALNEVSYGNSIEEMKLKHHQNLVRLCVFLFAPTEEDVYFSPKVRRVSELISELFVLRRKVASALEKGPNVGDRLPLKFKSLFNELISVLDESLIDQMVDYGRWPLFASTAHQTGPSTHGSAALHSYVSIFKNLLAFNHTPL